MWAREMLFGGGSPGADEVRVRGAREREELLREVKGACASTFEFSTFRSDALEMMVDAMVNGSEEDAQVDSKTGSKSVSDFQVSDKHPCIQHLICWLERCLWHGLFSHAKVSMFALSPSTETSDVSLWDVVEKCLAKDAHLSTTIKQVSELDFLDSGTAKSRAWLHVALNEKLLDAAILSVRSQHDIMRVHYAKTALLNSPEDSDILISLIAGLKGLNIRLEMDQKAFETRSSSPLRNPTMLVVDEEQSLRAFREASMLRFQLDGVRQIEHDRVELSALQSKLAKPKRSSASGGSAWSFAFKDAMNIAHRALNIDQTAQPNSNGGSQALDMAAQYLSRRARAKRTARKVKLTTLCSSARVFGAPLRSVATNPVTSALFFSPTLAVPDLVVRCIALLWSQYQSQKREPGFSSEMFASHFVPRVGDSDTKPALQLKHELLRLGGKGLVAYARIGIDRDLQGAMQDIAVTTSAGVRNSELCKPRTVAALLRLFFRQLPEPIIPNELFDSFMACLSLQGDQDKVRNFSGLVSTLESFQFATLELVLGLFGRIVRNNDGSEEEEEEEDNETCTHAIAAQTLLAEAFAPALCRPKVVSTQSHRDAVHILNILIEHHLQIMNEPSAQLQQERNRLSVKVARLTGFKKGLNSAIDPDLKVSKSVLLNAWDVLYVKSADGESPDDSSEMDPVSPGWMQRGSSSKDILSEFRGGGQTALQFLGYFLANHPVRAGKMVQQNKYPFFLCAARLARVVMQAIGLGNTASDDPGDVLERMASTAWWGMMDDIVALPRIFAMAFLLFDLNYKESKATSMDTLRVVSETKLHIADLLALEPKSTNQLWHSWIQLRAERLLWKSPSQIEEANAASPLKAKTIGAFFEKVVSSSSSSSSTTTTTFITGSLNNNASAGTDKQQSGTASPRSQNGQEPVSRPSSPRSPPPAPVPPVESQAVDYGQLLPRLDKQSEILDANLISKLETRIGSSYQGYDWTQVFSTNVDGYDINEFYRLAKTHNATILLIKDTKGVCFGAFNTCPWMISSTYSGNAECVLFALAPTFKAYQCSGENSYFMLCNDDSLAMGGGGEFGLFIDEDFKSGTSGPCETFDSVCLASEPDFTVSVIELWSFKVRLG